MVSWERPGWSGSGSSKAASASTAACEGGGVPVVDRAGEPDRMVGSGAKQIEVGLHPAILADAGRRDQTSTPFGLMSGVT